MGLYLGKPLGKSLTSCLPGNGAGCKSAGDLQGVMDPALPWLGHGCVMARPASMVKHIGVSFAPCRCVCPQGQGAAGRGLDEVTG
jgi:hypothetical protein